MKKIRYGLLFLLVGLATYEIETAPQKTMIITRAKGGLFACFFGVLNNLRWCEKKQVVPVVKWGKDSLYFEPAGYYGSTEPWEYYFEPVSDVEYSEVVMEEGTFTHPHDAAPDGSRIPPTFNAEYLKCLEKSYRKSIHKTIVDSIKIKPRILDKVHVFYQSHFSGKKVIGIHLRGTDKSKENKVASIEIVCSAANVIAQELPDCVFFLATDEERLLTDAKKRLKGPVLHYESFRSLNGKGIHNSRHSYSKAKLGEEVLIETLLLAKCDRFIHTRSNVSTAVLFFNPELENMLIE